MTIDERLEALTQTVELLALMHKENEVRFGKNEERTAQLMDTMNRMGRILEAHDISIEDLDKRLDNLEDRQ